MPLSTTVWYSNMFSIIEHTMSLYANNLKLILLDYLIALNADKQFILGSEIPYLSQKRRVDILCIYPTKLHAYEIKSDFDTFARLKSQAIDYLNTFDYTTLVISIKHMDKIKPIPAGLGVIVINPVTKEVIQLKKPLRRLRLNKLNLSHFLWKNDVLKAFKSQRQLNVAEHSPVHIMREKISRLLTTKQLQKLAIKALTTRYKDRFAVFMRDRGQKTHILDLETLSQLPITL